ncbi:hypothetical protein BS50DRAFT_150083 [Corynespora cassiicola Philippines]|uniref:Uncharacterized protein n=1 Tax=Corynespora cassiicola Philippines TaxID=1448308 RepID=A0A2T2N7P2_CORCC|nr:hypothetical protein BS50DRAFT_150083 [Corynespora cassiicola Philippines]
MPFVSLPAAAASTSLLASHCSARTLTSATTLRPAHDDHSTPTTTTAAGSSSPTALPDRCHCPPHLVPAILPGPLSYRPSACFDLKKHSVCQQAPAFPPKKASLPRHICFRLHDRDDVTTCFSVRSASFCSVRVHPHPCQPLVGASTAFRPLCHLANSSAGVSPHYRTTAASAKLET